MGKSIVCQFFDRLFKLSIDVNSPEIMYAAMWEHQRKPNKVISGGEGSGLYKSIDGGKIGSKYTMGYLKKKGKWPLPFLPQILTKFLP